MITVALDFDGVLSDYSGWKGYTEPFDPPVEGGLQAIRDYQDAGFTVWIYSSRADTSASIIRLERWLKDWGLEQRRVDKVHITNQKPPAVLYIDDRAFCFTGVFPSVEMIKNFKTWKGL